MDLSSACSEPFRALVDFHDQFNRNIKLASVSLAFTGQLANWPTANKHLSALLMSADVEPWGSPPWKAIEDATPEAKDFIATLGIVRATSAFEDYVTRCRAELDRHTDRTNAAAPLESAESRESTEDEATGLRSLSLRLGSQLDPELEAVLKFFVIARNCIVHRSNRASDKLEEVSRHDDLNTALKAWSRRRGKWVVALPAIRQGESIKWLPRHSIMASDCYRRVAKILDNMLVQALGADGMVHMATYWHFFADPPVPTTAKLSTEVVIRTQLVNRYGVKKVIVSEMIDCLRKSGKWDQARAVFEKAKTRRTQQAAR